MSPWGALAGAAAGAVASYFLDPEAGRRRRAVARDRARHAAHEARHAAGVAARDARNRGKGLASRVARLRRRPGTSDPDEVIAERVRAKLGRYCSHPHAIEVVVHDGRVELRGPVLATEHPVLVRAIEHVKGVREVHDELELHQRGDSVPALQGGHHRERRPELLRENWSPAPRLLLGSLGAALGLAGLRTRGLVGYGLSLAGAGLFWRSTANRPFSHLLGLRGPGIHVEKTMLIAAPLDDVYRHWDVSQFPRFMSHVREVRELGDDRYHWKVSGPAGIPIEWDAVVTTREPERKLAWKTVPGSPVRHAGVVRFERVSDGLTRISVRLSYRPPAGQVGHGLAKLFGADPKSELDDDLLRFQTLVEEGRTSGRHGQISGSELGALPAGSREPQPGS